ncbi:Glycoside hydrolase [Macleaya cordata]|uniref:Glycoside hydrolase n=1 Tax=Macleaya cordata TaxID=56857 RepID=A0A200PMW7_MACCD|nr:Glycoside hydrolase [Macleaya cordata]
MITQQCLEEPLKPQYRGGILVNPEFNNGLKGWSAFGGGGKITHRKSKGGNGFIVAHSRNQPFDTFSQKIYLQKGKLYTFSSWIQVSEGIVPVTAVFKTTDGFTQAGAVIAESGCWSMLKGGLTVNSSGPAELYFESNNTNVEIWVDSVSLQPFTEEQWRSHQDESIAKVRKRNVKIHAVNSKGEVLDGAEIHIKYNKPSFPFGTAITKQILTNPAYQNWFTSRFTVTVFENEMKWYATESIRGKEDYSVPDAMLRLAKQHGISVRGHNIFWDDAKYQPWWVKSLHPAELKAAADKRINSVVSRYAGQLTGWDVINENLHFSFFEDALGANASSVFFSRAHQLDFKTTMFLNDYNTIERSNDPKASPAQYLRKLRQIWSFPGNNGPTGIGLEGHFDTPNIPYMRAAIDTLAAARVPIWLTEVDVGRSGNQAKYLEQILREAHSHPAVHGIVLWAAWSPSGCWRMCLTDNNFRNLPTGDVVDKLINEWGPRKLVEGTTNSNGDFEISLFHGDYDVMINHPSMNSSITQSFKVTATETSQETTTTTLHVQVDA